MAVSLKKLLFIVMSYASAFGFSGYDPFGSMLEGAVSRYWGGKSAHDAYVYQKRIAKWQARNLPKYQREGLEAAGYNPLLAVSGGVGSQSLPSAPNMMPQVGSNGVSGFDASAFSDAKIKRQESKQAEIQTQMLEDEAKAFREETSARIVQARLAETEASATLDTLGVYHHRDDDGNMVKVQQGGAMHNFKNSLRNKILSDEYNHNPARAKLLDTYRAIHGVNEAGSAYDSWRGSRKTYHILKK